MKFLHAADIHLDSPLAGLCARDDLPEGVIRHCTRRAFDAMVQIAIDEDVAFVIIAGDLYDGDWKDFSTGLFFAEQMRRLNRPCFLLRGNHDAQSVITRSLRNLPDTVHEFSSRHCESISLPELGVALHGYSFPNRAVPEDLSASYPAPRQGLLNIGVLHTSAEDAGEHATYAPCSIASLALKGYDYWALGHIHTRQVLHERPWIVFPGNLQGRHVRETGAKGCTLVTVEDHRIVAVEHRPVDVLRWAHCEIDTSDADIVRLSARIAHSATEAVLASEGRPVLARITLAGETPLHDRLLGDTAGIEAEARDAAGAAGGALWVETVRVRTRAPDRVKDPVAAPLRAAFDGGLEDPAIVAALLRDLGALRSKLPPELQDRLALPTDAVGLRSLAADAWAIAAASLAGSQP